MLKTEAFALKIKIKNKTGGRRTSTSFNILGFIRGFYYPPVIKIQWKPD